MTIVEDILTDILQTVHLESTVFCSSKLTAPWGIRIAREQTATFHIVIEGCCWLQVEETEKLLARGDLVVLLQAQEHIISDNLANEIIDLKEIILQQPTHGYKILKYGSSGALTSLISGCFKFQSLPQNPLLNALPPTIYVKGDSNRLMPWLERTIEFIADEAAIAQPGCQTIVARLADIIFVQAIRAHILGLSGTKGGWLQALNDSQIGRALSLIHRYPEKSWTVKSLANEVVMSRSAFSTRFRQLVGEPPIQYLTNWRMYRAAEMLRCTKAGVKEIAVRVGYDSEVAFSRAFKRWAGVAPGAYRRS